MFGLVNEHKPNKGSRPSARLLIRGGYMKSIFSSVSFSKSFSATCVLSLAVGAGSAFAAQEPELVEVSLNKVFVPAMGYDDNDKIQIVLDGNLPNPCYKLDKAEVSRTSDKKFAVKQWARRSKDGICALSALPVTMNMLVPFTEEIAVGTLTKGSYDVGYQTLDRQLERSFSVDAAPVPTVDNMPYASVSSVQMPDVVASETNLLAGLSGVLTNSCSFLDSNVRVEHVGDVMVLLPALRFTADVLCLQVLRPFFQEIELGQLEEGRYLVHARSMNGKAVNKTFTVSK